VFDRVKVGSSDGSGYKIGSPLLTTGTLLTTPSQFPSGGCVNKTVEYLTNTQTQCLVYMTQVTCVHVKSLDANSYLHDDGSHKSSCTEYPKLIASSETESRKFVQSIREE
jgi:hypothetical protein